MTPGTLGGTVLSVSELELLEGLRRGDEHAAAGARVRARPGGRRGGRAGGLARRPARPRALRGPLVAADLAAPYRRQPRQDQGSAGGPLDPVLRAGRRRARGRGTVGPARALPWPAGPLGRTLGHPTRAVEPARARAAVGGDTRPDRG